MAKNTQEAEVIVTMNGQAAKKAVAELAQEYEKLQKEALEAYKAGNDALGKKLDAQAQKLMKDIEITRRETKKFADVMKNINGASLKELNSAAKQLFHVILSKMSVFFLAQTKIVLYLQRSKSNCGMMRPHKSGIFYALTLLITQKSQNLAPTDAVTVMPAGSCS